MRGRDFVRLGVDGHRWGLTERRRARREREVAVERALGEVSATHLARAPLSVLSGGELQRLRIAQALAGDPVLLLCDEPLLNLDPASAQQVSELIENLSQLYQTEVDVVRVRGQYVVVGNRGFCHE